MNFSEIFVRRPVMTTLIMAAFLIVGILGFRSLPVSDLPNVDFPTIMVTAGLPGASPETMAATVATPLEKQFSTIHGLDSMTSTNMLGMTQITLQFVLDRNLDAAAQDVQEQITYASRYLPQNMPTPPFYQKVNPADTPDPLPPPHLAHPAPVDRRRVRRDDDGPADLDGPRRRPGRRLRLAELRRPRPARPGRPGLARHRARPGRRGRPGGQRQPADRDPLRSRPGLHGPVHRPARQRRRTTATSS